MYNGRWLLWQRFPGPPLGPWRPKSKSWSSIGHKQAVTELLQFAWHDARLWGETCHVQGLL
eukprot:3064048-Heterocapsa_arctica.AAC.1